MAADVPQLDDPRLDEIVDLYSVMAARLSDGFEDMVDEEDPSKKFLLYTAVLALLLLLFQRSEEWAQTNVALYLRQADERATRSLSAIRPGTVFDPGLNRTAFRTITKDTVGHFFKARNLLEQYLGRVFRSLGLEQDFAFFANQIRSGDPTATPDQLNRKLKKKLVRDFRAAPVTVIGKNGKPFSYPLPYYAAMVAHNAKFQVQSLTAINRALEVGHDLVQISPQPSLHGDWCDAYRGKVFSISGATPGFATLDQLPNNGAPFHPWCRHTMQIYDPTGKGREELQEAGSVDSRFLLSQSNDFNAMVRAWWASRR